MLMTYICLLSIYVWLIYYGFFGISKISTLSGAMNEYRKVQHAIYLICY